MRDFFRGILRLVYGIEQKLFGGLGLGRLPFAQNIKNALFAVVQPDITRINGLTIRHGGVYGLLDLTTYKAPVSDVLQNELRPGATALDLGANIGYFTCLMAKLVGQRGKIIAFEPDPKNISLLQRNILDNHLTNIMIVPKAVSDAPGEMSLFTSGAHSSFGFDAVHSGAAQAVPIVSLDDFFGGAPPKIDLIKIDIIGSEAKALRGMEKLLLRNKNIKILSAFCPAFLIGAGSNPVKYLEKLFNLGFNIYDITTGNSNAVSQGDIKNFVAKYSPNGKIAQAEIFCLRE